MFVCLDWAVPCVWTLVFHVHLYPTTHVAGFVCSCGCVVAHLTDAWRSTTVNVYMHHVRTCTYVHTLYAITVGPLFTFYIHTHTLAKKTHTHTHTHTQMLPLSTNIREAYKNGQDDEQNFIQNLALFLCTFLRDHAILIEQKVQYREHSHTHCRDQLLYHPCVSYVGDHF